MNSHKSLLPLTGLRSIHNSRTRVYAAGRDPLFGSIGRFPVRRLSRPYPEVEPTPKLWRPGLLDRLQTSVTRYRD